MDLQGFDRIRLAGDEDCGVGLECLDCYEGGLPLVYLRPYVGDIAYLNEPRVKVVDSVVDLLAVARAHLDEKHS